MTEVAVREAHIPELFDDPTGGRLVAWAQAAHAAHQLATALCKTSFAPAHFRDNPGDTTAAIMAGDELGLSPLASMRSLYVVHGTPALYARTMVALVQSRGHEVWTEKASDESVTVCGQRRGSDKVERATWTIARAQRAGYTGNKKYQSNPAEMLYAKAASEICRRVAADVLLGIPATVEDIELEDTTAPEPRKVSRRKVEAEIVTPEPDPAPEPDDGPLAIFAEADDE
jgi:hypothetical protein